ncbi:MAG: hypothetical protein KME04_16810 [Pleurocapsa minor GSE-CHR-MK-17-07R]|jgi:enterochelin esterase family protein|nr:hypothetical protein [Pleurocapsa minor GSE-CHR-MK 17-07R]
MQLLERARQAGHPLIDGKHATFVWSGEAAPLLAGDFNGWNMDEAVRMHAAGPNLWTATLTFPMDAYVEYAYFASSKPEDRLKDPLNKRRVWNGVNGYNSALYMPDASPDPLTKRRFGTAQGTVTKIQVNTARAGAGNKRAVHVYAPPGTTDPYPIIVCWDGPDYLKRGHLVTVVDNLIADKRIWPVGLVMIENGKSLRMLEYMANEYTLLWLQYAVLPAALPLLNPVDTKRHPGAWGVMGASMGGLMALYTGLRMHEQFGHVLSQSGAFEFGMEVPRPHPVFDLVSRGDKLPLKIYQDVGTMEWLLDCNRRMHDALQKKQYDVAYHEFNAGHNYTAWSNTLARALTALYGR